jgi:hypothetical protein
VRSSSGKAEHGPLLVRLSYLAPDITEAILDGRQPRDLTADESAAWLARAV